MKVILYSYELVPPKDLGRLVHPDTWHYSITSMWHALIFVKSMVNKHRMYCSHGFSVTHPKNSPLGNFCVAASLYVWLELVPPLLDSVCVFMWLGELLYETMGKDNTAGNGHHRPATREAASIGMWRGWGGSERANARERQRQLCKETRSLHYRNPVDLMSYSFVSFVIFFSVHWQKVS